METTSRVLEDSLPKPPANRKRLLSVDIMRGVAIIGVLFVHPMVYGTWRTDTNALEIVPTPALITLFPIIVLFTWGGGFTFMSGIVNTYNIFKRTEKGMPFRRAVAPILLNSTFLFLVSPIKGFFFERPSMGNVSSLFTNLYNGWDLPWPDAERFFRMLILPTIAVAGFVTVFLLWILFAGNGREKVRRNVIILGTLGVVLVLINNPLNNWLAPYIELGKAKGGIFWFLALVLRVFIGEQLTYFPIGLYAIFGMIGGYLIAMKTDFKTIRRFGFGFGFTFLAAFIINMGFTINNTIKAGGDIFEVLFSYRIYPRELLFFSLGCICLIFVLLVKKFEYIPDEKVEAIKNKTKIVRNFGQVTLTLYVLEAFINESIATSFHLMFPPHKVVDWGDKDAFMYSWWGIILFVITFVGFWQLFVYLWSKIDFKFGFEHLNYALTKKLRKAKSMRDFGNKHTETQEVIPEKQTAN